MSNPEYFDAHYVPSDETSENKPPKSESERLHQAVAGAGPEEDRYELAKPIRRLFKARLIGD